MRKKTLGERSVPKNAVISNLQLKNQKNIAAVLRSAFRERCKVGKRHNVKMTQSLIASKLGMSQSLLSQYLSGDMPVPDHQLKLLCGFLRINENEIYPSELRRLQKAVASVNHKKRKKEVFVLDTGKNGEEWQKSKSYFEETFTDQVGIMMKFQDDIILDDSGTKIYEHGGALEAFIHTALLETLTTKELNQVKIVANWRWADFRKQIPGELIFMSKQNYDRKMREIATTIDIEDLTDNLHLKRTADRQPYDSFKWWHNWGPPVAVLNILLK